MANNYTVPDVWAPTRMRGGSVCEAGQDNAQETMHYTHTIQYTCDYRRKGSYYFTMSLLLMQQLLLIVLCGFVELLLRVGTNGMTFCMIA